MFITKSEKEFLITRVEALVEFNRLLEKKIRILELGIEALECNLQELNLKRPVVFKAEPKKRGRPVGSKAKRPKFPPKTPFELKKPLGRPKGSKNKPK